MKKKQQRYTTEFRAEAVKYESALNFDPESALFLTHPLSQ